MRLIPLLIIATLATFALPLAGQNCGCADAGNCPETVLPNNSSQICYEITDAFNNDLADPAQGVCGVYINFEHDQIGGLEMTLTSPDGTQVQLTGTTGFCNNWTPIATWNILFLPCSETCEPDTINACPLPCVFDNCPMDCSWPNAMMTGTYQPFSGCLEDFNSGPANGQWCLEIDNDAMFNGGTVFDFEVILCDQTNLFCCDADAGNLAFEPNISACEGDSALLLTPEPLYGAVVPDPSQYGYTYSIFQNNTLIAYDSLTDLQLYPVGTYTVCGLSFLWSDSMLLPGVGSPITAVNIYNNLNGPAPTFCGDIDTNCIIVNIATPPAPANLIDTICVGDTIFIGATPYIETGMYSDTLVSMGGCDSIVNLNLTVVEPDTVELDITVCNGGSYIVGQDTFDITGMHEVTLQNRFGCDSTIFLDLTVLQPIEVNLSDTICLGDTVWVGSMPYFSTGNSTDTLTTPMLGCDSIVNLELIVVEVSVNVLPPDTLTCALPEITLSSNGSTTLGTLTYQWITDTGNFPNGDNTANVEVDDPGMYWVTVSAGNCSAVDSVNVEEEVDLPTAVADAIAPELLTCAVTMVQLDATNSTGGSNLTYQWNGPVSDPISPTPSVSQPGIYEVVVTNEDNGCTDTAQVEIFQNIIPPIADAGQDTILSCTQPTVTLDGTGSSPSGNISYLWTAMPGNIISLNNIADPEVDEPGVYELIVSDLVNACQDTAYVQVTVDSLTPQAIIEIPGPDSLTCINDVVTLDGSNSLNTNNTVFTWIGNIASGQGTDMATVTSPGQVSLAIYNTVNGCSDTTTVNVFGYFDEPMADAGSGPDTISCTNLAEDVGGIGSSFGSMFSYEWTSSPGGSFTSATDEPFATVDSAGVYYLTVTNMLSGCTAIDSAIVHDDLVPLAANVVDSSGVINCRDSIFTLDASNSVIEPFSQYEWQNTAGQVISGNISTEVNYPDTFYFILSFAFCEDTAQVVVTEGSTPPVAHAGSDLSLECATGQATLDGSLSDIGMNIVYQWSSANGIVLSGQNTTSPIVDGIGEYIIEVTDTLSDCISFDTVAVFLDTALCTPFVDAGADGLVFCNPIVDSLSASGDDGPQFTHEWFSIPGNVPQVVQDWTAPIFTEGIYVLVITNTAVGLMASDTVQIFADDTPPVADAGSIILPLGCPEIFSCYELDASGSSQGTNIVYEWSTLEGAFCSSTDILNVEILGPGTYELFVMDMSNRCTALDNIEVQLDDFLPEADVILENVQMVCGGTDTLLEATALPFGANLSFQWSSSGGSVVSGGNTLLASVAANNTSDIFYFTVTNDNNNCTATDSVTVFAPVNCEPECVATVLGVLDCDTDTVTLSAFGSSLDSNITYLWTALTGNLCGGDTTDMACADQGGIYRLTVTRTYPNGAPFSTFCDVAVTDLSYEPVADAGPDDDLNCVDFTLELDGTGSEAGSEITYLWTTSVGNILNGEMTTTPEVDAVGIYELLVLDTVTGCFGIDSIEIGIDVNIPDADAGPDQQITCTANNVLLDGSTSFPGMEFLWTTDGGNICSNPNQEDISACAGGIYFFTVTNPVNGCATTDTVMVTTSLDFPEVDVGDNLFYTCADTIFTIPSVIEQPGSGSLSFSWSTTNGCFTSALDILQPTVNCPGIYSLTVTDLVNTCTSMATLEVIEATTPPVANAGITQEINCQNLQLQLDGSGSTPAGQLDFEWSTINGNILLGDMTAMPTIDSAGDYQLIVTDQFTQCKDTSIVNITLGADIPAADAGPDTTLTCARIELNLDGTDSETGLDILYEWTGPGVIGAANTQFPLINLPGLYILEVTDTSNMCVVTDTVMVGLDTISPIAHITASQDLVITCAVQELVLSGNTSTPTDSVGYFWSTTNGHIVFGINSPAVTIDSGGVYTLTVTHDRTGCTDQENILVNEDFAAPFVQVLPADTLTCDSLTIQLEVLAPTNQPIYEFAWSGPNPILNSNTRKPTVSQQGVYFVTITNTENGCTGENSVIVSRDVSPPIAVASSLGQLDCDNIRAQVSGEGSTVDAVSYQWTTNTGGNIFSPNSIVTDVDAAGKYYLIVRKLSNGCTSTDSTVVVANAVPISEVFLSFDQPDCIDNEGYIFIDSIVGGTPPYFYSLNDDIFVTYPQFSYLDSGPYDLLVEDINGCDWETEVSILLPNEVLVELGDDIYINQGESADLEAQVSIDSSEVDSVIWTNLQDSVDCPMCLDQIVFPLETTTYYIQVFDSTGCWAIDDITVVVNEEHPFFVPTGFSPNGDNVNDRLIFYAGEDVEEVVSFMIFDRWGNKVFHQKNFPPNNPNFGWDGNFQGRALNPAVFAWKAVVKFRDGKDKEYYGGLNLVR